MASIFRRNTSSLSTVIGITVVIVAIVGRIVFGWTWTNPDSFIPVLIGIVAAVAGAWYVVQRVRQ